METTKEQGVASDDKGAAHYDRDAVTQAARGRWPEILANVAGIPREVLDGKHHPCRKCGGTDRFRMIDEEAGAVLCNQCFDQKNGDGFAAIGWLLGVGFQASLAAVARYLKIEPSRNGSVPPVEQVRWILHPNLAADARRTIEHWCTTKPPIVPEAVEAFRGRVGRWPKRARDGGYLCLGFGGRGVDGQVKAVLLYRASGEEFPAFKSLQARKSHLVARSSESWIWPGTVENLTTAEVIVKTEGPTDALAFWSTGLPDGWLPITNACGAKSTGKLDFGFAKGKRVLVIGDRDKPGEEGARRHAAAFHQAGAAEVRIIALPYEMVDDHGKDLRDWLAEGHGIDDFQALANAAKPVTDRQAEIWGKRLGGRDGPTIMVTVDERAVVDQAVEALAREQSLYQRGLVLVHVITNARKPRGVERPDEAPRVSPVQHARLREMMSSTALWMQATKEGPAPCHVPEWAVKAVAARQNWPNIRPLEGVVEAPTLRADGTVLQTPGYDDQTGLIFRPSREFPPVPDTPTKDDAFRALDLLAEPVADFPFADHAHFSAWVSALLTPFARYAFSGPAPLFTVDANSAGTGKGLLCNATSIIYCGREMSVTTAPRSDEEFRKRITSIALAAEPVVLIDNIVGVLNSPSLNAVLTSTYWSDRLLGRNEMACNIPMYTTWFATANNLIVGEDTSRRIMHIRLETDQENPEERQGFKYPHLLDWVRERHPELAVAALTVLAAYCRVGRPDQGIRPWGSYEAWSALVRGAIVWAGLADPMDAKAELVRHADTARNALQAMIEAIELADPENYGMTATEMIKRAQTGDDVAGKLWAALVELVGTRDGKLPSAGSVGRKLAHVRKRWVGGRCIDRKDEDHHKTGAIWCLRGAE